MRRLGAVAALLIFLAGAGCSWTWQANKSSQAVDVHPLAVGSGDPVFTLSNGPGYMNGDPQDARTK
jgi:hypothetical protein